MAVYLKFDARMYTVKSLWRSKELALQSLLQGQTCRTSGSQKQSRSSLFTGISDRDGYTFFPRCWTRCFKTLDWGSWSRMPSQGSRSANDEREAARRFIVISLVIIVGGRAHDDGCM
jgi:hypothetical protein